MKIEIYADEIIELIADHPLERSFLKRLSKGIFCCSLKYGNDLTNCPISICLTPHKEFQERIKEVKKGKQK